jgi:hypothetical protein
MYGVPNASSSKISGPQKTPDTGTNAGCGATEPRRGSRRGFAGIFSSKRSACVDWRPRRASAEQKEAQIIFATFLSSLTSNYCDRIHRSGPKKSKEIRMASSSNETKISLQVGSELRIKNDGDIVIDNPELELAADERAADAVLIYRFDARAGEHVLRLLEPVADHRHMRVHRRDD